MALCPDETNLLAKAGCDLARSLLPAPFHLRFSNHDTGRQMTICAEGLDVWIGSVWHNSRYEFNDRGKIAGLQPDFEFARPIIDKFFDDVRQAVAERDKSAAEQQAQAAAAREAERRGKIAAIRAAVSAA